MNEFLWTIHHALFLFPLAWFYSHALLSGIAFARDEQHRMTPLSPWFYFWVKFRRPALLNLGLSLPWLSFAVSSIWVMIYWIWSSGAWPKAALSGFWNELRLDTEMRWTFIMDIVSIAGIAGLMFATITRLTPKLQNPLLAGSLGVGFAVLIWRIFISLANALNLPSETIAIPFALLGLLAFVFVWVYVRFKLNRAWFRFEDN